ncbi:MAG: EF-P lysine aminoacylase GenX [Pseudomonadales bacterium]|nr:EF-P lysine aminoacylase GenX [Pseudomonadales bacterium]
MADWRPSAAIGLLQRRAVLLAEIREFFRQRQVLEVETPLLCATTATDPHLDSIRVTGVRYGDKGSYFLQTSPEFAMKKLLAAGSGSIFQICKAFRRDECGRRHNPEFTMLEWYRTGFDEHQLMDEVAELVGRITGRPAPERISYRQLFQRHLMLDPLTCDTEALLAAARRHVEFDATGYGRDDLLQLLLAEVLEPALDRDCFVYDFPPSMAALARVTDDDQGTPVGRRFELFMDGMEIANGYWELTDASEQEQRFKTDMELRLQLQRDELPVDQELLAALAAGLPDCAGVALGVDRLLMVATGADSIDAVLSFRGVRPPD